MSIVPLGDAFASAFASAFAFGAFTTGARPAFALVASRASCRDAKRSALSSASSLAWAGWEDRHSARAAPSPAESAARRPGAGDARAVCAGGRARAAPAPAVLDIAATERELITSAARRARARGARPLAGGDRRARPPLLAPPATTWGQPRLACTRVWQSAAWGLGTTGRGQRHFSTACLPFRGGCYTWPPPAFRRRVRPRQRRCARARCRVDAQLSSRARLWWRVSSRQRELEISRSLRLACRLPALASPPASRSLRQRHTHSLLCA